MKLYRTRTQAEYDYLMQKLEDEGYVWRYSGDKPTGKDYWSHFRTGTVIKADSDYKNLTRLILKHAEEPIIEVSDLMDTVDHDTLMQKVVERNNKLELVNHPDHYQGNKFEVIDIIEDYELNFTLGSAVKYILRAGKKDDKNTDLKKAIWMLERELEEEE